MDMANVVSALGGFMSGQKEAALQREDTRRWEADMARQLEQVELQRQTLGLQREELAQRAKEADLTNQFNRDDLEARKKFEAERNALTQAGIDVDKMNMEDQIAFHAWQRGEPDRAVDRQIRIADNESKNRQAEVAAEQGLITQREKDLNQLGYFNDLRIKEFDYKADWLDKHDARAEAAKVRHEGEIFKAVTNASTVIMDYIINNADAVLKAQLEPLYEELVAARTDPNGPNYPLMEQIRGEVNRVVTEKGDMKFATILANAEEGIRRIQSISPYESAALPPQPLIPMGGLPTQRPPGAPEGYRELQVAQYALPLIRQVLNDPTVAQQLKDAFYTESGLVQDGKTLNPVAGLKWWRDVLIPSHPMYGTLDKTLTTLAPAVAGPPAPVVSSQALEMPTSPYAEEIARLSEQLGIGVPQQGQQPVAFGMPMLARPGPAYGNVPPRRLPQNPNRPRGGG